VFFAEIDISCILLNISNSDKWFQLLDCVLSVGVLGTCSERKINRRLSIAIMMMKQKIYIYKANSIVFFNRQFQFIGCKGLKAALPSLHTRGKASFDRKILTNITIFARVYGWWRVKELLLQRCRSHDMTANHRNM